MRNIKKEITFIYTDKLEHQCAEPIAKEAEKRGYKVKFSDNQFEKCEIGFYCQHINYPENSKFSCIMLHDLAQQHTHWPNIWKNEFWSIFDVGFLPSKEWANMWQQSSCYAFARPRYGCFFAGWPKADNIHEHHFQEECSSIIKKYGIDVSKKTILYAPSWEWDNRQLEIIDACRELDVNLIIKQFPWNPEKFKEQYDICSEMEKKSKGIPNVFVLDPKTNIFNAIQLCDVLVSEESSTLVEAMMLDKTVIAVTDWLVPDEIPPRQPDFPFDFAIHIKKNDLRKTIQKVITDSSYKEKIIAYRKENFPNIGQSAKIIMDVIDFYIDNKDFSLPRVVEFPLKKTPSILKKSIYKRKKLLLYIKFKMKIIEPSRILSHIWKILKDIKNKRNPNE